MRRYQCLLLCWRRIHKWCERWRAWCTVWSSTSHIQMRFVWDVSETVSPLSITDPLVQEQLCIYVWSIVSMWHWYSWEKSMMYKILIRAGTSCRREVMIVVLRYEVDARYKSVVYIWEMWSRNWIKSESHQISITSILIPSLLVTSTRSMWMTVCLAN